MFVTSKEKVSPWFTLAKLKDSSLYLKAKASPDGILPNLLQTEADRRKKIEASERLERYHSQYEHAGKKSLAEKQSEIDIPEDFDPIRFYRNFSKPKGLLLVINNRVFAKNDKYPDRLGSDIDCKNLVRLFECQLDYKLHNVVYDLNALEMREKIDEFACLPQHADMDSCVVVILTYSEKGLLVGKTDQVSIGDLVWRLSDNKCPNLDGKPKLFFVQACRSKTFGKFSVDLVSYYFQY